MHPPLLQRIRRRPVPPAIEVAHLPGGAVTLDLNALWHQLELREQLRANGLRGRV